MQTGWWAVAAGAVWAVVMAAAAVVVAQTPPQAGPAGPAPLPAAAVGMLKVVQHTVPAPATPVGNKEYRLSDGA
jgi:hypothetical protein